MRFVRCTLFSAGVLLVAALVGVPVAGGDEGASAGAPDHVAHDHVLISILPRTILPEAKRLRSRDTFGWLNYSKDRITIRFPREVARKLSCTSPGLFELTPERLEASVEGGGFASLCSLAPGEYPYQVAFHRAGGGEQVVEATLFID